MKVEKTVSGPELAKLKALAGELLAVEAPELSLLDGLAAAAAEVATSYRDEARRRLLQRVAETAPEVFPAAAEDFRHRLDHASHDELSSLAALLDEAGVARTSFAEVDAAMMAARDRGDYAAVAPLALEADARKTAFAAASAQFANRLGLGDALMPDLTPHNVPAAAPEPSPPEAAMVGELEAAVAESEAPAAAEEERTEAPLELNMPMSSPSERRRVRDLIRHIRPATEEAPTAP